MIRLGKKWEAEHILWEEKERQNEAEMKIKEMELLSADKSYVKKLETIEARKAFDKCFGKSKMNMADFLAKEKALMLRRLKPKEKKFVPFTKDIRVVDAKRRMSEASIQKLKSIAAKVRASEAVDTTENETSDDAGKEISESQADSDKTNSTDSKSKKAPVNLLLNLNSVDSSKLNAQF